MPRRAAQRRVQQVGGGVVALGRVPRGTVDVGVYALARLQLAALGDQRDDLVVADAQHVGDAGAAVAVGAFDVAGVGDLAAAGGVER